MNILLTLFLAFLTVSLPAMLWAGHRTGKMGRAAMIAVLLSVCFAAEVDKPPVVYAGIVRLTTAMLALPWTAWTALKDAFAAAKLDLTRSGTIATAADSVISSTPTNQAPIGVLHWQANNFNNPSNFNFRGHVEAWSFSNGVARITARNNRAVADTPDMQLKLTRVSDGAVWYVDHTSATNHGDDSFTYELPLPPGVDGAIIPTVDILLGSETKGLDTGGLLLVDMDNGVMYEGRSGVFFISGYRQAFKNGVNVVEMSALMAEQAEEMSLFAAPTLLKTSTFSARSMRYVAPTPSRPLSFNPAPEESK